MQVTKKNIPPVFELSVVIPVYNEVENIRPLWRNLLPVLEKLERPFEVIFVDDGSTDGTKQELLGLCRIDSRFRMVQLRRNFGQTAALHAGLHEARGRIIVTMDGDQQNDPRDIPAMLHRLEQDFDLVYGWRKKRHDRLFSRRIPSRVANWLIRKLTGFPASDLGCAMKAMRREVADDLPLYGEMHRFIPILAHWQGARCTEFIVRHHPRQFGETNYGLTRALTVVLDLITVKFMIQYFARPMAVFGGIGLACLLLGAASAALTIVLKVFAEMDMTGNPFLLLSVFSVLMGGQFFVLGLLGEVSVRIYYKCQGRQPYAVRMRCGFEQNDVHHVKPPADNPLDQSTFETERPLPR